MIGITFGVFFQQPQSQMKETIDEYSWCTNLFDRQGIDHSIKLLGCFW